MDILYSDMRATGPSTIEAKVGDRSSRVHKIGHTLQNEESLATVVDDGDALRIHRLDRYRFSTVKVRENTRMLSISLDTERMTVRNTKINASLCAMSTTTGVERSETGPNMEQCYPKTEQVCEITNYTEGGITPRDALYPTMRVLFDSKMQPTNHSRKFGMYERAVIAKTNPRGEYNATERFGNVTIKENDQERITLKKDAMRKYRAENKNTSKNVGARQY